MEKKTIGQFIAALRKASGMTQKQLSERLNISDKAVSRWERDECAPDLSLIPVIAEIFGVTSDEILRGERKFGEADISEYPVTSAKSTKQVERILNDAKLKFSIRSIISVGIAIVGLLGAMLCNFGFNRAHIGFIVACVLYLAAAVCETIFVIMAFSSVSGEDFESENLGLCKKGIFDKAFLSYALIFVLLLVSVPLVVIVGDAYWGLTAESWFAYGLNYFVAAVVFCGIVKLFSGKIALKCGLYTLSEKESNKIEKLFKHDRKYLIILACVLLGTFIIQAVFMEFAGELFIKPSYSFNSVEDFVEFMETPTKETFRYYDSEHNEIHEDSVYSYGYIYSDGSNAVEVAPSHVDTGDLFEFDEVKYFDMYGNEIPEEEALKRYFYGPDDKILYTYIERNESVSYYSVKWDEEGNPTINVRTHEDVRRSNAMFESFNQIFVVCYVAEVVIVSLVWFILRRKIK